jgi:hypothetical protein
VQGRMELGPAREVEFPRWHGHYREAAEDERMDRLWLVFAWAGFALAVAVIAGQKGRSPLPWFLYGFAIWPVALIHALALRREEEAPKPPPFMHTAPIEPPLPRPTVPAPTRPSWPGDARIRYRRAGDGVVTERRVTLRGADIRLDEAHQPTIPLFVAYCHLRQAPRHFRFTNLLELTDLTTGEVLTPPLAQQWVLRAIMQAPGMRVLAREGG